jgi:hypothetical protein
MIECLHHIILSFHWYQLIELGPGNYQEQWHSREFPPGKYGTLLNSNVNSLQISRGTWNPQIHLYLIKVIILQTTLLFIGFLPLTTILINYFLLYYWSVLWNSNYSGTIVLLHSGIWANFPTLFPCLASSLHILDW